MSQFHADDMIRYHDRDLFRALARVLITRVAAYPRVIEAIKAAPAIVRTNAESAIVLPLATILVARKMAVIGVRRLV